MEKGNFGGLFVTFFAFILLAAMVVFVIYIGIPAIKKLDQNNSYDTTQGDNSTQMIQIPDKVDINYKQAPQTK